MRPAFRRLAAASLVLPALLESARAEAVEVPNVGGKPLLIDVTNTAVVSYRFDNRNDANLDFPAKQVDDFYFEWLDRFNVQASWWRFRLGVRVDAAVFRHGLSRDGIAARVADQKPIIDKYVNDYAAFTGVDPKEFGPNYRSTYENGFQQELHTRFRRAIYPSKLFLGYNQPGIDVTVGDFYVQLGRGLVFSVRKVDELAIDTTVRGAKVVFDKDFGSVRLAATLFGGQMNPLRVDETSGRRLNGSGSPLFFAFPRAGDLQTYDVSDPGRVVAVTDLARATYLEDTAAGGRLELGFKHFSVAANSAVLLRQSHGEEYQRCLAAGGDRRDSGDTRVTGRCAALFPTIPSTDPSKRHDRIVNAGGSINVPSLGGHGDLYLEAAGQHMGAGQVTSLDVKGNAVKAQDLAGYAIYGNASITGGPVSVSLEGKHYRNYFPLSANIDTQTPGFGAPELALVVYSQPPTAEPIYTQIARGGSPGVCVTGGRGRVDYRFNRSASVYAWLGRYVSWSETPRALDAGCMAPSKDSSKESASSNQTNTWDMAAGTDIIFDKGKSHLNAWIGGRSTEFADPQQPAAPGLPAPSQWFYKEGYIRYDFVKHLTGPFSIQLQGFHRRRYEPLLPDENAWTEGENYTALQWSPYLSLIFGYEYLIREQCQPGRSATLTKDARPEKDVCHFVNGGVQWRAGTPSGGAAKVLSQLFNTVNVFVGQRRAALRCVSGVCRQFPPFEGARLEITSRF